MRVYKTTLVIWSDRDPSEETLEDLGREADQGGSICSQGVTVEQELDAGCPEEVQSFFGLEEE